MRFFLIAFFLISSSPNLTLASDTFGSQLDELFGSGASNSQNNAPAATGTTKSECPSGYIWTGTVCAGDGISRQMNDMTCPNGSAPSSFMGGEQKCSVWDRPYTESGSEDVSHHTNNRTPPKSDNATCQAALDSTAKKCKGAEWSQYSAVALQLGATFVQMKNANNTKAACETAKKISALGITSNGAVAGMCAAAVSSCKKSCKDDEEGIASCNEFNNYTKLAAQQSVENATAYAGSSLCADMAGGECNGDSAYDNEQCTQFCFKPGRQNHPKCASTVANCANPTYAAQNVQTCTCVNNPFSPSCTTNAGTSPIPGSGNNNLNFDDSLAGADYDFDGVKGDPKQASTNAQQGSGSNNGGGFGGGSSVFGDDAGGGAADLPNKDILTGVGNASGGGGIFGGGGGYNEGNGNAANKAGGSGGEPGIDLRAFLPGGKKDPTRNPASAGYADATITKANGLTNWQKVTRKMNEKRPELMP